MVISNSGILLAKCIASGIRPEGWGGSEALRRTCRHR
jgi:hypothetical protein